MSVIGLFDSKLISVKITPKMTPFLYQPTRSVSRVDFKMTDMTECITLSVVPLSTNAPASRSIKTKGLRERSARRRSSISMLWNVSS